MSTPVATDLMTPAEVAAVFHVNAKTVSRWANAGKLTTLRTLGGHRRFMRDEVEAAAAKHSPTQDDAA